MATWFVINGNLLMFKFIDNLPVAPIAIMAIFLSLAPFQPEPHLVEKLRMLSEGTLSRPIDIFDLILHSSGLILLGVKILRMPQDNSSRD